MVNKKYPTSNRTVIHKKEMVVHPGHYSDFDHGKDGIECMVALRAMLGRVGYIAWLRGNIFTYLWRMDRKEQTLQDVKKIEFYTAELRKVEEEVEK